MPINIWTPVIFLALCPIQKTIR